MQHRSAFVLLSALFLAGCQTVVPQHIALPEAAKTAIASTDVVLPISQSEIYIFVPNSNVSAATGGGLLGALIDVSVNSVRSGNAETAVKPLRDALVDYDFDKVISAKVKTALTDNATLHITGVKSSKDKAATDKLVSLSPSAAVLVGTCDYQLDNDGKVLTVSLAAGLYPNTAALKAMRTLKPDNKVVLAPQNVLYRNTFTYTKTMTEPAPKADRDAYIAAWSANKGAPMQQALDEAADALAKQLAGDL